MPPVHRDVTYRYVLCIYRPPNRYPTECITVTARPGTTAARRSEAPGPAEKVSQESGDAAREGGPAHRRVQMKKLSGAVLVAVLLAVLAASLVGAAQAQAVTKLNVFAAASLNKAFPAEAKAFKLKWPRYKAVKFVFNFQGTDILTAQLEQDPAAADVFAGASLKYGTKLAGENIIITPKSFCQNKLCVILPAANTAGITSLAEIPSKATSITVGTTTVPVGTYTGQVLDKRWPVATSPPTTRPRSWPSPSPCSTSPRSSRSSCTVRPTPGSATTATRSTPASR